LLPKKIIISLLLFFSFSVYAQFNADSVEAIWQNKNESADNRLEAAYQLIIYEYSKIDLELARETAKEMLALSEISNNDNYKIEALRSLGIVDNYQGNYISSLNFYEQALIVARNSNNKIAEGNVLTNIGNHFGEVRMLTLSMNYFNEALKIFNEIDYERGTALIFDNMGLVYIELENYEKAEEYMNKSLEVAVKYNLKRVITFCHINLCVIYKKTGLFPKAKEFCEKSISFASKISDSLQLAECYSDLSEINLQMQALNDAKKNANISIQLCKRTSNFQLIYKPIIILSKVYKKEKEYQKALIGLNNAYGYAEKINSLEQKTEISHEKYNIYKLLGENDSAIIQYEHYTKLNEALNIENSSKDILLTETKNKFISQAKKDSIYYAEKDHVKNEKIIHQEDQLSIERLMRYGLIVLLVLTLGLVYFIYNRFRLIRKQRNIISEQKKQVDQAHSSVKDSIEYTEQIQRALLPSKETLSSLYNEYFIFYLPKDILSGDFYWTHNFGDKKLIALGDCTGHGIPGAYMTIMAINLLSNIIEKDISNPEKIIAEMDRLLIDRLRKNDDDIRDGLDLALCLIEKNKIVFSSTHIPLYHISNQQLNHYKGSSVFLGDGELGLLKSQEIEYQKGDIIYLLSDGYADQKGGKEKRKFYSKRVKELIINNSHLTINKQHQILETTFLDWKGNEDQVDDVTVLGIRLD